MSLKHSAVITLATVFGLSSPDLAEAKAPSKREPQPVEVKQETLSLNERLRELMTSWGKSESDVAATRTALIATSRHEFCVAVEGAVAKYMGQVEYKPGRHKPEDSAYSIPYPVGEGDLFEGIVAPTLTKGCLSPEERLDFFSDYQLTIVEYYSHEMATLLEAMKTELPSVIRNEQGSKESFEKNIARFHTIAQLQDDSSRFKYGDLFADFAVVSPSEDKYRFYNDAVQVIESLTANPGDGGMALEAINIELRKYSDLYKSGRYNGGEQEGLFRGMMALYDYQSFLMKRMSSDQESVTGAMKSGGEVTGKAEFEASLPVPKTVVEFQVPGLDLTGETESIRSASSGDSLWLRKAELLFYNNAAAHLQRAFDDAPMGSYEESKGYREKHGFDFVKAWDESLTSAREGLSGIDFDRIKPELQSYDFLFLQDELVWNGSFYGLREDEFFWSDSAFSASGKAHWQYLTGHCDEPGTFEIPLCEAKERGLTRVTNHYRDAWHQSQPNYHDTPVLPSMDVPYELLDMIARENVAAKLAD